MNNPADYLSRHARPATGKEEQEAKETEEYISLAEIVHSSQQDDCLQLVKQAISTGNWKSIISPEVARTEEARQQLKSLYHVKDELAITEDGCILRGARLVIPSRLTQQAVDLAHCSHQGMVKTKSHLRAKVWFPSLDVMVENTVQNCPACQTVSAPDRPAPIITEDIPLYPWHRASADFGQMLVVMDDHSRYPEVEIVSSTGAGETIAKLEKIMATHGLIRELITDPLSMDKYGPMICIRRTQNTER